MSEQGKRPAVYVMASRRNGTRYAGATSDLKHRVWQHKFLEIAGFTAGCGCTMLVWYEHHEEMREAISREKQMKAGSRRKKLALIEASHPNWRDVWDTL